MANFIDFIYWVVASAALVFFLHYMTDNYKPASPLDTPNNARNRHSKGSTPTYTAATPKKPDSLLSFPDNNIDIGVPSATFPGHRPFPPKFTPTQFPSSACTVNLLSRGRCGCGWVTRERTDGSKYNYMWRACYQTDCQCKQYYVVYGFRKHPKGNSWWDVAGKGGSE